MVNTTEGVAIIDSQSIRRSALLCRVAYFTTVRGAHAATEAIAARRQQKLHINALQAYHR